MASRNRFSDCYRHQDSCPNRPLDDEEESETSSSDDDSVAADRREARKNFECCSDRRCTTWFDLRSWFGYLLNDLPRADFKACFTDVAHGGIGLFEKLIVLGGKTLETFAEIHFYEQYVSAARPYLPRDLAEAVGPDAARLLWTHKRVERVTAAQSLYAFGRGYLTTAQVLPTRQAVGKYVKACVGFACQSADTENLYKWMPVLVEHVFWVQRVRTEAGAHANDLLQDLQEYLGYKHDHLLPRIRECLRGKALPQRSDTPTGRELVRLYAADYFNVLAQESGVEKRHRAVWADEELEMFMEGPAIPLFSTLVMSLQPFLMTTESRGLPSTNTFAATFYSLVAACWVLSTEDHVKVWMPALIQRLRQIQLVAQLSATAGSAYSRALRRRKLAAQPVELQHMAAANNGATNVFRLWNVDTERPPAAAPGAAAQWLPPPPAFPLWSESPPDRASAPSPFLSLCGPCGGSPTRGSRVREGAAALPPGDGPLFVVEQGSPEGLKEPKRITLKPFARVVTPARRGRARQSPPDENGCCVFSYGRSSRAVPSSLFHSTHSEEAVPASPTTQSALLDQQTTLAVAPRRAAPTGHRRLTAASPPPDRRDGPAPRAPAEEASRRCWSPCGGDGGVCTPEGRSGSADIHGEGDAQAGRSPGGAAVSRPLEHRLKIRYIPGSLEDAETSLSGDEEDDRRQDKLRKASQAATVEVFLDEVQLARETVTPSEKKAEGEPDVRAVLTGPNLKPLCINFKAQGAAGSGEGGPPAVYLTEPAPKELEGEKRDPGGPGLEGSPKGHELLSAEQLLQHQQFQLELQQLQLQQLQLQQQMQQEMLRQAGPPDAVYPRFDGERGFNPRTATGTATIKFGEPLDAVPQWQAGRGDHGERLETQESAPTSPGSSPACGTEYPRQREGGKKSGGREPQRESPPQQQADQLAPGRGCPGAPRGPRHQSSETTDFIRPVDIIAYPSPLRPPAPLIRAPPLPVTLPSVAQRKKECGPVVCTVQVPNVLLLEAEGSRPRRSSGDRKEPWWPGCAPGCGVNQEAARMQFVPAPAMIQTRAREGPVFQRQRTKSQASPPASASLLPR